MADIRNATAPNRTIVVGRRYVHSSSAGAEFTRSWDGFEASPQPPSSWWPWHAPNGNRFQVNARRTTSATYLSVHNGLPLQALPRWGSLRSCGTTARLTCRGCERTYSLPPTARRPHTSHRSLAHHHCRAASARRSGRRRRTAAVARQLPAARCAAPPWTRLRAGWQAHPPSRPPGSGRRT